MPTVEIKISPDGTEVTSDAHGFVGKKCADFMRPIINALRASVIDDKKKPEFYKHEHEGTKITGR